MARVRKIRTMLDKLGDAQLKAMWDLKNYCASTKEERQMVRDAIRERVIILRHRRNRERAG